MNIARLMNRDVVTTRHDDELAPLVEMMMRRGLSEVPVVDHDQALLGLVTRADLVNPHARGPATAEEFLGGEQLRRSIICALDDGFHLDIEPGVRVADVMSRTAVAVRHDATTREAARLMAEHQLSALPVVSGYGVVIGMVSALDLVRHRS